MQISDLGLSRRVESEYQIKASSMFPVLCTHYYINDCRYAGPHQRFLKDITQSNQVTQEEGLIVDIDRCVELWNCYVGAV